MPDQPKILVSHGAPHRGDPDELASAITTSLPDADVRVTNDYDELLAEIETAAALVTRLDLKEGIPEVLDRAENLRWIHALSAGYNKYDLERLREMDVVLTNASGVHANPIAEQVMGYLTVFERRMLQGIRQQARKEWCHYRGGELNGQTMGIVGVGEIGGRIAELGSAFGMEVLGVKRDTDDVDAAVDEVYSPAERRTVVGRSDYLVVACPLTDDTYEMIGARDFDSMKSSAVVVNVGRGKVIDEDDLEDALQNGQIAGAALDVQATEPLPSDSPLWTLSNVIVTPHMAGSTPHYLERCADIFVDNYDAFRNGDYDAFENRVL